MSYDDRIKILKERKLEETRVKSTRKVYQDGDDYGSSPAPETYQFHCIPNHENGSWYGYDGWSKNFYKLMTCLLYTSPAEFEPRRHLAR